MTEEVLREAVCRCKRVIRDFFVREDDFVKKSAFFFVCFIQISMTIFVNDFDGK